MSNFVTYTSHKKRGVALVLCVLVGFLGAHQFYVGRVGKGVLYLFTGGVFGIGVIIDFFKILFGSFKDCNKVPLIEWW